MINIELDLGKARGLLKGIEGRAKNMGPVLQDFSAHMEGSILENFIKGGRPNKWKESSSEKTLRRSGGLQNSVTSSFTSTSMKMGSNSPYGRIHHKGGVIKPKKARALAIPLQDWIKGGPRRYTDLTYMPVEDGAPATLAVLGKQNGDDFTPMFVLVSKVTMPARPWLLYQPEDRIYAKRQVTKFLRTGEL